MEKPKFSDFQIAFIPRQAEEETPVVDICRKAGISDASPSRLKRQPRVIAVEHHLFRPPGPGS